MPSTDTRSETDVQRSASGRRRSGNVDDRHDVAFQALGILRNFIRPAEDEPIHIDIGGRCVHLAAFFQQELKVDCIGIFHASDPTQTTAGEPFATWDGRSSADLFAAIARIADGRRISSLSVFNTLEFLPRPASFLRDLSRLAEEHNAYVLFGVQNSLCFGNVSRLMLGQIPHWPNKAEPFDLGRMLSAVALDRVLSSNGLHVVNEKNIFTGKISDQDSTDHPVADGHTELGSFVRSIRLEADQDISKINCFMRLCVAGPMRPVDKKPVPFFARERPFLSVVMRTQGKRLHTLREALLSLYGQTDSDFEIIVIGHKLDHERSFAVSQIIDEQPTEMRQKSKLILTDIGNRTYPLNLGFGEAEGRYIAILDDDDIVFANWVEVFKDLHRVSPGRLLRSVCLRQTVRNVTINGQKGLRAEGPPEAIYAQDFDIFEHLRTNNTPPLTVAFPRGAFHDLGLRFDETLTTTEDWDFIQRVALLLGVANGKVVTCIYRWWDQDESSRSVHTIEEWQKNHRRIQDKIDANSLLLPMGSASRIRKLLDIRDEYERMVPRLHDLEAQARSIAELQAQIAHLNRLYQSSIVLRMARMVPAPVRRVGRGFLYFVWRYLGFRALWAWRRRRTA